MLYGGSYDSAVHILQNVKNAEVMLPYITV